MFEFNEIRDWTKHSAEGSSPVQPANIGSNGSPPPSEPYSSCATEELPDDVEHNDLVGWVSSLLATLA
jgi:hypothetical protein